MKNSNVGNADIRIQAGLREQSRLFLFLLKLAPANLPLAEPALQLALVEASGQSAEVVTQAATDQREREDNGEGYFFDHNSGVASASGVKSSVAWTGTSGAPVSSSSTPPTKARATCMASQSNIWLSLRTRFQ